MGRKTLEKLEPAGLHKLKMAPMSVPLLELEKLAEPLRHIYVMVNHKARDERWELRRELMVSLAMTFIKIKYVPAPVTRWVLVKAFDFIRDLIK